ncbi:reverse transcriptase domain-containing protein [Tanacetum coccineum]
MRRYLKEVSHTSLVYDKHGLPYADVSPPSRNNILTPRNPQNTTSTTDKDEREPMFIHPRHDPGLCCQAYLRIIPEDPEEYEDDETEDGLVDYPVDGGDDGDDDDGDSSEDDADDKDEDEDEEDEEEEEDHLALADSAIIVPIVELVSPPEGIEPVIPPPSTDITTTGARIIVRLQASISLPPEAEVERLLAMPTPPPSLPISLSPPFEGERLARYTAPSAHSSPPPVPSPLLPSSGCPTQIQTLRIASTQALVDAVTAALPSPLLPPLPPSLYIPPHVDRRDDIPESEWSPRKRSCLFALGPRYEVGESSTARPTGGRGVEYGDTWVDPAEAVPEIAHMTVGEFNTMVTELAELHEHDTGRGLCFPSGLGSCDRIESGGPFKLQTHREQVYALESQLHAHQTQLQLQGTLIQTQHQVHETRSQMQQVEMTELRETGCGHQAQIVETLRVMRDMRREMGDMQTELLGLRDSSAKSTNGDGSHSSHGDNRRNVQTTRPCFYANFMKCQPLNFKGNEGVVGLTRWIEKMESVFNISGCAIENQVKFATCTLLGAALTWWNGQIRTLGADAYSMTWEVLKKKMTDKYYPQGEIKKLEIELWNLKVKGNDVPTYTERFQELTLICTKFVANETEKVDKYISGLPNNIYGNVKSSRPKTLDETIELANDLMDQKLHTYAERQTENKRKADDSSRNNHGHQKQPFKRQNVTKVYNMGSGEKKPYGGSLPKSSGNANVANAQRDSKAIPKGNGWVYAIGNAKKNGNASRNPDSNVVTGTFLLNNRYASILFDTGAYRSFISTAFSSLIDIAPTPLENSYDVELADEKIVGINTIVRGSTLNFLNHPFCNTLKSGSQRNVEYPRALLYGSIAQDIGTTTKHVV